CSDFSRDPRPVRGHVRELDRVPESLERADVGDAGVAPWKWGTDARAIDGGRAMATTTSATGRPRNRTGPRDMAPVSEGSVLLGLNHRKGLARVHHLSGLHGDAGDLAVPGGDDVVL